MKSFLLFAAAIVAGFAIAATVGGIFVAISGKAEPSSAMGMGAGLLSFLVIFAYGSLWSDRERLVNPPSPRSPFPNRRELKAESKRQTAELRFAFVFAVIGGLIAGNEGSSNLVITLVVIVCAMAGVFFGHDYKRRVRRLRERHAQRAS